MIAPKIRFDHTAVTRRFSRLHRDGPKWIASEMNRQLRASKGGTGNSRLLPVVGMTRRLRQATNITPQKRIARRIRFPRSARATAKRLSAGGLTLFEAMPQRYFSSGIPSGARLKLNETDPSGRQLIGEPFAAKIKKRTRMMRLVSPRRTKDNETWLPINDAYVVDLTPLAYRIRAEVQADLAQFWPRQMERRFAQEFRRIFGA